MHRPAIGDRGSNGSVYRARIVVIAVSNGAVTAHIDPRPSGTHDYIPLQGGLAGNVQRRAADALSQCRERHPEWEGKRCYPEQGEGEQWVCQPAGLL